MSTTRFHMKSKAPRELRPDYLVKLNHPALKVQGFGFRTKVRYCSFNYKLIV